jgi:hypothetical protein
LPDAHRPIRSDHVGMQTEEASRRQPGALIGDRLDAPPRRIRVHFDLPPIQ